MAYWLKDNALKISAGYEIIDMERPFEMGLFGCQEPSVKFARPDAVDLRAKRLPNPMTAGYAVDPGTVPRMVRWCDQKLCRLVDVDLTRNTMLVSERVRETIERFEPGVHQFLPVDIYLSPRPFEAGDAPVARSYWLVVGQCFDAVSAEHTRHPRGVVTYPDGTTTPGIWLFKGDAPIVFDSKVIAGRHLWVDSNFVKTEYPFLSDELGSALVEMDLYGAQFQHFEDV